ncbi:hypothetical protein HYY75_09910 [bacterium]|nr:hypothetical protein [bacterium]
MKSFFSRGVSLKFQTILIFSLFRLLLVAPEVFSEPMKVEVGMYVLDVSKIDIKDNQFFADFYLWFKWVPREPIASWSPESVEFMNGSVDSSWEPIRKQLSDGSSHWIRRFRGTFRSRFNLQSYPFDTQTLPILLEDNDQEAQNLEFSPNLLGNSRPNCQIETSVQVPGWKIKTAEPTVDLHVYETDFGEKPEKTLSDELRNGKYSRFSFMINLERLFVPHLIKFVIPLLVIAGMAYMVFFINEKEFGAQCGICITSLLSAVALHSSQANALPAVGYLVVADKIFILFYILIFSALFQTVVVDWYAKLGDKDFPAKLDKIFRICYPLVLLLGSFIIFVSSGFQP